MKALWPDLLQRHGILIVTHRTSPSRPCQGHVPLRYARFCDHISYFAQENSAHQYLPIYNHIMLLGLPTFLPKEHKSTGMRT